MSEKYAVKVRLRDVALDAQGRAIEALLQQQNLSADRVRVGKYIEVELSGAPEECDRKIKEISEFVLYNPLIETCEIEKR